MIKTNACGTVMGALMTIALIATTGPTAGQIRPETSGKSSFSEPELRTRHEGLYRPNEPHRGRRFRHHHFERL